MAGGIDEFTVLMLHMDGADGSTTFTDDSDSAHTVIPSGSVEIDTSQYKFGGSSAQFSATNTQLSIPDSVDWNADGAYTVDFWVRFASAIPDSQYGGQERWSDPGDGGTIFLNTGGTAINVDLDAARPLPRTFAFVINTWYHVEWNIDDSNDCRIVVNWTQIGATGNTSALQDSTFPYLIGQQKGGGKQLLGWLDEYRVSRGIARHTANFTPETEPYTALSTNRGGLLFFDYNLNILRKTQYLSQLF